MSSSRFPGSGFVLAVLIAVLAFCSPQEARAQTAQVQWNGIDRVIAFADVHGATTNLVLLRETGSWTHRITGLPGRRIS
jgi:hypothetical protein